MSKVTQTKNSLPWRAGSETVEYFVEVGTTPYGKYGLYKEMIPVGIRGRGRHLETATEIQLSNPDIFENLKLRQVVSRG
jgi:hypothetical protein|tara:strand:- start:431 stop:667 length:237 start_codon:yes stop_codon:yes gene_type:complete